MRATGRLRSSEAHALASRTAKHFAHKVPVEEADGVQRIETRFGSITLEPRDAELVVVVEGDDLAELKRVAGSHVERFAREKGFALRWD